MDLAYSTIKDGQYDIGARCHQQRQGAVPVWVVTDTHGNILINNQASRENGHTWVVSKGRITVTRFWSASTAMIVCCVEHLNPDATKGIYTPFPELSRDATRILAGGTTYGKIDYPLDKNDEICIWCGYIEMLRPVTINDLKAGNLLRTFVGVVDTIVGSGGANQGSTLIIQCRDRMKYLMDSLSTYNSTDSSPLGLRNEAPEGDQTGLDTASKEGKKISRVEVLLEIARRSIGHLQNAYSISVKSLGVSGNPCDSVCGLRISEGYTRDFISDVESDDDIYAVYDAPLGTRDYFGVEPTSFTDPPPKTSYLPSGANVGWVDDSRLNVREQIDKYYKLSKMYNLPSTQNIFNNIGNSLNETPETVQRMRETFLKEYEEAYGKPFEEPVEQQTDREANARRMLDEVDSSLNTKQLFSKYYGLWSTVLFLDRQMIPADVIGNPQKMKEFFLRRYKQDKGVEYATTIPEFQEGLDKIDQAKESATTPFIGGTTVTPSGLTDVELAIRARHPAMNIITGRYPFDIGATGNNFAGMSAQVTDRIALEYIKFLAMQEPWPTEFFCDHRSGEYWYAPRGLDITGLEDPKRFYRTYFMRHASEEALAYLRQEYAHPCQALLLFREESSSINWRSNIIVTNTPSNNSAEGVAVHLKTVPPFLKGRAFACTYYTVNDETISDNDSTALFATALAFARLYGKELKAASMHIVGDPSLCPGECVQVLGSSLYGGGYLPALQDKTKTQWRWDRDAITDYYGDYKDIHKELLQDLRTSSDSGQPLSEEQMDKVLRESFAAGSSSSNDESSMTPNEIIAKYSDLAQKEGISIPSLAGASDAEKATSLKEEYLKAYQQKYNKLPDDQNAQTSSTNPATDSSTNPATDSSTNPEKTNTLRALQKQAKDTAPVLTSTLTQAELMCPATFVGNTGSSNVDSPIDIQEDPKTIWRVEAIIHKFNDSAGDGYKTEVALLAPW
jgi:hypothetical protein